MSDGHFLEKIEERHSFACACNADISNCSGLDERSTAVIRLNDELGESGLQRYEKRGPRMTLADARNASKKSEDVQVVVHVFQEGFNVPGIDLSIFQASYRRNEIVGAIDNRDRSNSLWVQMD
jgi:hypothetical protein